MQETAHSPCLNSTALLTSLRCERELLLGVRVLKSKLNVQETAPGALAPEELEERIKDVHVLGIRSKMQLKGSALQHAEKLLAVGCFCIGTNQVDLEVGLPPHSLLVV